MSILDLAVVKAGVQATGFTDDDTLLQQLTDAAEKAIENYLRREFAVDFAAGFPADLAQAIIMLVYHFYENSEQDDDAGQAWPPFVKLLLSPYRNYA